MDKLKLIKDQIHGNIIFSKLESELFSSAIFNRLHYILQNSMSYLVYPTNKTSRFIHSVGTCDVASKIYNNSLKNSSKEILQKFLLSKKNIIFSFEISKQLEKDLGLKKYSCIEHYFDKKELKFKELLEPLEKLFGLSFINHCTFNNTIFDDKSLNVVNIILLQSLRFFALLHDYGHLPFSHLTEFAIESLFDKLTDSKESELYKKLKNLFTYEKDIHEIVGEKLTYLTLLNMKENILKNENIDAKLKCGMLIVINIIIEILQELYKAEKSKFYSLYMIISSDLDADRIDYTLRDGLASSLIEKGANTDRILKMFKLDSFESEIYNDSFRFYPAIESLNDIDEFYLDRDKLYKIVFNHHKVKKFDYILEKIITEKLYNESEIDENDSNKSELNNVSDLLSIIFELIEYDTNNITQGNIENFFYKFSQITDYWLLSIIKKDVVKLITCMEPTQSQEFTKELMDELFGGIKKFKSLWKRDFEFFNFLDSLIETMYEIDFFQKRILDESIFADLIDDLNKDISNSKKGIILFDFLNSEFNDWQIQVEKRMREQGFGVLLVKSKFAKPVKELQLIELNTDRKFKYSNISTTKFRRGIMFFIYYSNNVAKSVEQKLLETIMNFIIEKRR